MLLNEIRKLQQEYWENYYKKNKQNRNEVFPSPFALYSCKFINTNDTILELGCGDGRDTFYFAKKGYKIVGCDNCKTLITGFKKMNLKNPLFMKVDFTKIKELNLKIKISIVYVRFILHALDKEIASTLLRWSFKFLENGGRILTETRSIHDPLYGVGKPAGKDAFISTHYRRFVRRNELAKEMEDIGFVINENIESTDLAPFGKENPPVIRIIAQKV